MAGVGQEGQAVDPAEEGECPPQSTAGRSRVGEGDAERSHRWKYLIPECRHTPVGAYPLAPADGLPTALTGGRSVK